MPRRATGTVAISAKIRSDLRERIEAYALDRGVTVSKVVEEALSSFFSGSAARRTAQELGSAGYQDGLRRGYHDSMTAIQGALEPLWQE